MANQQVVLVTGCSQGGIGYELCKAFAKAGCRVFASARKLEAMNGLPELGIDTVQLDVTSAESRKQAVDKVVAEAGRIDILVNNAGMGLVGPLVELDLDEVRNLFETNFFGLLGLTQQAVPHMAPNKAGKVVNIGSIVGYISTPWGGAYAASKAAVHSLTDALRLELIPLGIQTILIVPGAIVSNIGARNTERFSMKHDTLYSEYKQVIQARATASQTAQSTATDVFAARVVRQVLRRSPPRHFAAGYLTRLFRFMRWMPLWIVDRALMKKFGIRRPAASSASGVKAAKSE